MFLLINSHLQANKRQYKVHEVRTQCDTISFTDMSYTFIDRTCIIKLPAYVKYKLLNCGVACSATPQFNNFLTVQLTYVLDLGSIRQIILNWISTYVRSYWTEYPLSHAIPYYRYIHFLIRNIALYHLNYQYCFNPYIFSFYILIIFYTQYIWSYAMTSHCDWFYDFFQIICCLYLYTVTG